MLVFGISFEAYRRPLSGVVVDVCFAYRTEDRLVKNGAQKTRVVFASQQLSRTTEAFFSWSAEDVARVFDARFLHMSSFTNRLAICTIIIIVFRIAAQPLAARASLRAQLLVHKN